MDTYGVKTDPAILLIHGAGSSRYAWHEDFCERLAGGGRFVIRHDGTGASVDARVQEALRVLDDRAHLSASRSARSWRCSPRSTIPNACRPSP